MDTDDLSKETYKAIFYAAEKCHHNLTLEFGLLASHCKNDNDYLDKAYKLILRWKSNLKTSSSQIFFDTTKPADSSLLKILTDIESKIISVQSIPIEKRTFEF
jgi:hypothetical protein